MWFDALVQMNADYEEMKDAIKFICQISKWNIGEIWSLF